MRRAAMWDIAAAVVCAAIASWYADGWSIAATAAWLGGAWADRGLRRLFPNGALTVRLWP